jgi:transposase
MRRLGYNYETIARELKVTQRAVQYTCEKEAATPQHHKAGRAPRLNKDEVDHVEQFVTSSKKTRQMTYLQIAEALWPEGEVGASSVRYALNKRGYHRRVALRKPPITEANRVVRLQWAHERLNWTPDQWNKVLWSDETWVKAGRHRKTYITRRTGEELNPTCVIDRVQRQSGWMFWGCFAGTEKGPSLFWEKEWGSINKETYSAHTIPIIHGWLRLRPSLIFMQDNAPSHAAKSTREDFEERGIYPIFWPAFSPDLNSIETVWNKMKDWLAAVYPDKKATYDQLRLQVTEAWNAIGEDLLAGLVASMPTRCKAVIDANGMHIPR